MIPPEYGAGLELGWHASGEPQPAVTPHERLHRHTGFRSRVLPDVRDLIVYTPPGYEADRERMYPVLYLQDGQNLFDPETSYIPGQTWQVREAADAAIEAGEVEPLVIVGIYNTGVRRMAEYTHDADRKHGGGIFWTLVGMFLGLIYGAYEFWIVVRMLNRADDDHHGTGNGKKKGT